VLFVLAPVSARHSSWFAPRTASSARSATDADEDSALFDPAGRRMHVYSYSVEDPASYSGRHAMGRKEVRTMTQVDSRAARWPPAALYSLGFAVNFLDTLGVGSFATATATLKLGRLVDDDRIPGTLNVGNALPTMLEALLFIALVAVDRLTLVSMVVAGCLGAWFGTGVVVGLPRHQIQRAMAVALVVTAGFIAIRQLDGLPSGGDATGLTGVALAVAVLASALIGALTSLGIGNYAPTMALLYVLGMSPLMVFPIMAACAAIILPTAALRFHRSGRYSAPVARALTLGGLPGVLVAFYLVRSLEVGLLRWLVVAVLCYTCVQLYRSSLRGGHR
jgi:uncharacterized membrane protein YfcA